MDLTVQMPVITASGEEAVVTAWFVDEGGPCTEGQLLAEVQAEKVAADVQAPFSGYVIDRVAINEPVEQGSVICRIVEAAQSHEDVETGPGAAGQRAAATGRVVASPSAKRIARELGVDLTTVPGTGPGGRITETDVRGVAPAPPPGAGGLRAVIARNMRRAHAETAPVTLQYTVALGEDPPSRITATIVKTVAQVLARHPHLNGRRHGDEFHAADEAQISLAIQTVEGLVAPVVRDAAEKQVAEIASDIEELAARAQAGELTVEDYEGGTFTVTNLGAFGIDGFTPIINLPQVAILGVGALRRVPVVGDEGTMSAGYQIVLSLTFDHAFVDGAPAAEFLKQVGEALRVPNA